MNRIEKIKINLEIAKEGHQETYAADVEYLLSIIEWCENACEGILEAKSVVKMKSLAKVTLKAIHREE